MQLFFLMFLSRVFLITLQMYDSMADPLLFNERLEVSDGSGPVDALAKALKQALLPSHPTLEGLELVDYKVRILDPESATNAATRVMIEFRNGEETWSTVSVDRNIISASVNALVDGFEYALIEHAQLCMVSSVVSDCSRCGRLDDSLANLFSFCTVC